MNITCQIRASKFDRQVRKGMFVGYMGAAYRICILESCRILVSKDMRDIKELISQEIRFASDDREEPVLEKYITIPERDIEEPMDADFGGVEQRQVVEMEFVTHYPHLR